MKWTKTVNTLIRYSFFNIRKPLQFLLILCCIVSDSTVAAEDTIIFGMFPAVPPVMLEKRYGPLTKAFEELLASKVVFRTKYTPQDFFNSLENGEYDIAVVQRFNYLSVNALNTMYRPLLRRSRKGRGVIVVAGDSGIKEISELKNRTIAVPSHHSAASFFATYMFTQAGFGDDQYSFVDLNNHDSCMQGVVNKKVVACATTEKLFKTFANFRKYDLKVISQSIELPGMFLVTHSRIDHLRDKLLQDLLEYSKTKKGAEVLGLALLQDLVEVGPDDFVEMDKIINELRK